jgi:multiple sugar transport system substrate-binding protein
MSIPTGFAMKFFNMNFYKFINPETKEINIDNEEFIAMLEKLGSMKNLHYSDAINQTSMMWETYIYSPLMDTNGTNDYSNVFLITDDEGNSDVTVNGFVPSVNINTKDSDLAIDFLKFAVSEELQTSPELLGYNPINRVATERLARLKFEEQQASQNPLVGIDFETNIKRYNEMVSQLAVASYSDTNVNNFVFDAFTRFFDGEMTAEEVAKDLQAKLTIYFNE